MTSLGGSPKMPSSSSYQAPNASFSTPFGNFTAAGNSSVYQPWMPQNQLDAFLGDQSRTNTVLGGLPTTTNINDYYNNPFYQSTASLLEAPINRQYQQDQYDLQNNLNAKNQVGSSYDALMNRNLMQGRDYNLQNADNQARQMSAQAYDQNLNNGLSVANANQNNANNYMSQWLQPLNYGEQMYGNILGGANNYLSNALAYQQNQQRMQQQGLSGALGSLGTLAGLGASFIPGVNVAAPLLMSGGGALGSGFGNAIA